MKRLIITSFVSILVILGFYGIYLGLVEIWGDKAQELIKEIDNYSFTEEFPIGITTTSDLISVYEQRNENPVKHLFLTLENDVIFAGDTIGIKLEAQDVDGDIDGIFLIFNDGSWTTANKTRDEIIYEKDRAQKIGRLIEVTHLSTPKFTSIVPMRFMIPNEDIYITGAMLYSNKTISIINMDQKLITIYSQTDKLQTETNISIKKQTEQTEFSNLQQERTNQLFLGLSIIAIALVPIVSGFDFLFRIHIDNNRKEDDNYKIYS